MTDFHLIEPCCGTGSFSLGYVKKGQMLVPFQGNKWRLREGLAGILVDRGLTKPKSIHLNDAGPWGTVWRTLLRRSGREQVLTYLKVYGDEDPREVFDEVYAEPVE